MSQTSEDFGNETKQITPKLTCGTYQVGSGKPQKLLQPSPKPPQDLSNRWSNWEFSRFSQNVTNFGLVCQKNQTSCVNSEYRVASISVWKMLETIATNSQSLLRPSIFTFPSHGGMLPVAAVLNLINATVATIIESVFTHHFSLLHSPWRLRR